MAKILIIEDNEYLGRMYENLLSLESYNVAWVASGEEGLERAESFKPDLILLDVIMPKINGIQVLQKLKDNILTQNIQVIILTVIGEKEIIDKCMKLGASGYIIKSTVNLDQLLSEINSYIKKSS
jgi:CheY-like chemotaxis protein